MAVIVEIGFPDGTKQTTVCAGSSIVVGTREGADVCITRAPELAAEHLLVMPRKDGCWLATARDASVQPLYQGKPFENGMVPFGAEMDLGSITVKLMRATEGRRKSNAKLLLVALPIALVLGLVARETTGLPRTNAEPPHLFEETNPVCGEPARAGVRAKELMFAADSMEIRYAYDPLEGLRAIARYREAAQCATSAHDEALAAEAQLRHRQLEQRIDGDFRSLRIRLDRARVKEDASELFTAAHAMRSYLVLRPGPYRDWLAAVERHVSTRIEQQKRVR